MYYAGLEVASKGSYVYVVDRQQLIKSATSLKGMGIGVYVVNPNKVRLISEAKRKADKVDAKVLAGLLRIGVTGEDTHV